MPSTDRLSKLKEEATSAIVSYRRFLAYNINNCDVILITEADDDAFYYNNIVKSQHGYQKQMTMSCDGKSNVLAMCKYIIKASRRDAPKALFFVDRDFDGISSADRSLPVYVTEAYSFEHYYLENSSVRAIIKSLFNIKTVGRNIPEQLGKDRESLIEGWTSTFFNLLSLYRRSITSFNAFLLFNIKTKNIRACKLMLNNISFTDFVSIKCKNNASCTNAICNATIDCGKISFWKNYKINDLNNRFSCLSHSPIPVIRKIANRLYTRNSFHYYYGKFEFGFFLWYLKIRSQELAKGYFKPTLQAQNHLPKISFSHALFLQHFSSFADVPNSLKQYVKAQLA